MKKYLLIVVTLFVGVFVKAQTVEPTEDKSLMEVTFLDFKDKPRINQFILFQSITNKKIFSGKTNNKGIAQILLPEGDNYQVRCISLGDTVDYDIVAIEKEAGAFSYALTLKYEPPKEFTLDDLNFDLGKATIKTSSFAELNELYNALAEMPTLEIEIGGHTDNTGNPADNLKLSQERAAAVRNYLIKKGIAASRITAKGFGDTQPIAYNNTEAGRAKNRRTEVRITKQ
jgi:outer membrane protein OmpA-like peptidoglycan-associated protein